ncbi:jg3138, partial [Pararge aegeria aegeria]
PLSVSINSCEKVTLGSEAFSWLLSIAIENVELLVLRTAAFNLDPTAANVGEHGPGMTIHLKNIAKTDFPDQIFRSSAALISLEQVVVGTVHAGAFSANTYNIVMAINCTFHRIAKESFASRSLINNLHLCGCKIIDFESSALQSAIAFLNITLTRFEHIETGAINATVVAVVIVDSVFRIFNERGFELSSWNKLQIERNSFDELAPNAIVAPGGSIHELTFVDNEIEVINPGSIGFIGQAYSTNANNVIYKRNYFGQPCHCNVTSWLAKGLNAISGEPFENESYCTVDEFFARCFNVPEQNMLFKKFHDNVCNDHLSIQCETYKSKELGAKSEIKNPRFPHKKEGDEGISDRNKKVIGIVIVTVLGCVIIIMFISFIRWMRRRGHCVNIKNFIISSNSSCGTFCDRLCVCRANNGMDNARSISQLSVNEYSERHRLNEPRVQDVIQETTVPTAYTEEIAATENKTTQTLPEELTKELLENLKEKLDDPENYVEAREMIEHLYELIKVEENCNNNSPTILNIEENIYELPFQSTTPRIGKNKKQMISVGTRTPSLDKLMPLSPYNRQTALAHEYFEPKDFAVHLYAEIANCDKEKRSYLGAMPDVVAEQAIPRGPYLRAVREKISSSASASPSAKSLNSSSASPQHTSTIKSNKSTASQNSAKMMNRPLPEKPAIDPGEGTSFRHG